MKRRWFCLLLILPVAASADDHSWKRELELGAVITSGNTEEETLNSRGQFTKESPKWRHTYNFDALRSSKEDELTAQKLHGAYKIDYRFRDDRSLFGRVSYEDDRFSGYDYQADVTFGYGQTLLKRDDLRIDGDIGPGVRRSKTDAGATETEGILRVAGALEWIISESATFTQALSTEFGSDATITRSVSGLRSTLTDRFAMKLSFSVKHSSEVPPGSDKTDTETSVTLVYSF